MTWKRDLGRALLVGAITGVVGDVIAQLVTFPSRYVSAERNESKMLHDTTMMMGLLAAFADFAVGLGSRRRRAGNQNSR